MQGYWGEGRTSTVRLEGRTHERVHRQYLPEAVSDKNRIRAKALPKEEDLSLHMAAAALENYPMESLGIQILLKGTWELNIVQKLSYLVN